MRPSLSKSVFMQELRFMREEQSLSNSEIAERLGVSKSVIHKYLGKGGPRKPYDRKEVVSVDFVSRMLSDAIGCPCNFSPLGEEMVSRYCGSKCNYTNSAECWKKVIRMWTEWEK